MRTAGAKRTKLEIKRDYKYIYELWDKIREKTLKSTAPETIYKEAGLINRAIRDMYSNEIEEVIVAGDNGYKTAKTVYERPNPIARQKGKKNTRARAVSPCSNATKLKGRFPIFMTAKFTCLVADQLYYTKQKLWLPLM